MGIGDRSRATQGSGKRYVGVGMQQGRLLTDADFNDGQHLPRDEVRRAIQDLVGPVGTPDDGLKIDGVTTATGNIDFDINPGTFFIGGLRLELPKPQRFSEQADWLQWKAADHRVPAGVFSDLVYVELWQQDVTGVEDRELLEPALGSGADTTTRTRTMFRVHRCRVSDNDDCATAWKTVQLAIVEVVGGRFENGHSLVSDAHLKVSFSQPKGTPKPCDPVSSGGYAGGENQAIRVQLLDNNDLTWGFDNATALYRVTLSKDDKGDLNQVKFLDHPKDEHGWPRQDQVVEILPRGAVLSNGEKLAEELSPGHFSKVLDGYDPDTGMLSLEAPVASGLGIDWQARSDMAADNAYFFLRLWDRGTNDSAPARIPRPEKNKTLPLGDTGLEIGIAGNGRIGDHWIISARPDTPHKVLPWALMTDPGAPPEGYARFYAPLALIRWEGSFVEEVLDCRPKFRPLTVQQGCCVLHVGDGERSHGDFDSIHEAVRHLPASGGRICVLPGLHRASVGLKGRKNIHITGCGADSIVVAEDTPHGCWPSIFCFSSCSEIRIEELTLFHPEGSAITFDNAGQSSAIRIGNNRIFCTGSAIRLQGYGHDATRNAVRIHDNLIGRIDSNQDDTTIDCDADGVVIEDNTLVQLSADPGGDGLGPALVATRGTETSAAMAEGLTPNAGGLEGIKIAGGSDDVRILVAAYVTKIGAAKEGDIALNARGLGGIRIAGGSEDVRISGNRIIGGKGNGITLGGGADGDGSLYDIQIDDNLISRMGLSGISFERRGNLSVNVVDGLVIRNNRIRECATDTKNADDEPGLAGIDLDACVNSVIARNTIEDIGIDGSGPVFGIRVGLGSNVDLNDNRIVQDGRLSAQGIGAPDTKLHPKSVGIKILTAPLEQPFEPTLRISNNIVIQSTGLALELSGVGPMSIIGNQFTTIRRVSNTYSLAGAVFVYNLGGSRDMASVGELPSYRRAMNDPDLTVSGSVSKQVLHSGFVQFSSNRSTLAIVGGHESNFGAGLFSAQLIESNGDISYSGNQSELDTDGAWLMSTVVLLGDTIRSSDNSFQEGVTDSSFSLTSLALMNTAVANQATHCISVNGPTGYTLDEHNLTRWPANLCETLNLYVRAVVGGNMSNQAG